MAKKNAQPASAERSRLAGKRDLVSRPNTSSYANARQSVADHDVGAPLDEQADMGHPRQTCL